MAEAHKAANTPEKKEKKSPEEEAQEKRTKLVEDAAKDLNKKLEEYDFEDRKSILSEICSRVVTVNIVQGTPPVAAPEAKLTVEPAEKKAA